MGGTSLSSCEVLDLSTGTWSCTLGNGRPQRRDTSGVAHRLEFDVLLLLYFRFFYFFYLNLYLLRRRNSIIRESVVPFRHPHPSRGRDQDPLLPHNDAHTRRSDGMKLRGIGVGTYKMGGALGGVPVGEDRRSEGESLGAELPAEGVLKAREDEAHAAEGGPSLCLDNRDRGGGPLRGNSICPMWSSLGLTYRPRPTTPRQ